MPAEVPPVSSALARLWAALAGGDLTDPESRALAARAEERFPGISAKVRAARRFHSLAALKAVQEGARGVIFGAAGLPVEKELCDEAARACPRARFLFADPDETVTLLRRARCRGRCSAVCGSMRDPAPVLAAAEAAGLEAPLHVQMVHVATYWPDSTAGETAGRWGRVLGPGGSLALTAVAGAPPGYPGALPGGAAPVYPHSPDCIRGWLEDAGLTVEEPGVVPVSTWPLKPAVRRKREGLWIAGAVGRVRPAGR